jgi:multiple sugar transport system substrate-binding protein
MTTRKLSSLTRRRFLKNTALTVAATGTAPMISAPFVSKALAADTSLSILQWAHFVPEYDTWFDKFATEWGEKNKIAVTVDHHIPVQNIPARAAMWMTVIGADLARFPARNGNIAFGDASQKLFDVPF